MKLYRTQGATKDGFNSMLTWQGTQADAAAKRKELIAADFSADTVVVEVPTDKPSLLAWLNANVTGE